MLRIGIIRNVWTHDSKWGQLYKESQGKIFVAKFYGCCFALCGTAAAAVPREHGKLSVLTNQLLVKNTHTHHGYLDQAYVQVAWFESLGLQLWPFRSMGAFNGLTAISSLKWYEIIRKRMTTNDWLVVLTILKNMKVNGKDYLHILWKIKNVPNHQPDDHPRPKQQTINIRWIHCDIIWNHINIDNINIVILWKSTNIQHFKNYQHNLKNQHHLKINII